MEKLVDIKNLKVAFPRPGLGNHQNTVVRGVDLEIYEKEIVAIIGESGSGKSVLSSTISGLLPSGGLITEGNIIVNGQDVTQYRPVDWEAVNLRGKFVSQVFQDPKATLNPYLRVGTQLKEAFVLARKDIKRKDYKKEMGKYLTLAGLEDNHKDILFSFPHQISGGQRQRVVIAIALACNSKLIVCDEPTTAIDPVIQAQVLNTILDIRKETGKSFLFISHDLGVVSTVADRVYVMYAGKIIEKGTTAEIMYNPQHPYTWGLLLSMPDLNKGQRLKAIRGTVPSDLGKIQGDAFADRNDFALEIDTKLHPPFFSLSKTHQAATWLLDERSPKVEVPKEIRKRWNYFKKTYGKGGLNGNIKKG